jgi:predicted RNA-binding protein YlqC (UPF0109 family)
MAKKPRKSKPKSVMRTDIKDLEVSRALRRLGNVRVNDWEFGNILPKIKQNAAREVDVLSLFKQTVNLRVNDWEISQTIPNVKELATAEVDVLNFFKRTANIRVTEWEIGGLARGKSPIQQRSAPPSQEESQTCIRQLSAFLGFVARNLIEEPDRATIMVSTPSPSEIRFRLLLTTRDTAALIGHGGHTAAAIRNLMKHVGSRSNFFVELKILSHQEAEQSHAPSSTRTQWKLVETADHSQP